MLPTTSQSRLALLLTLSTLLASNPLLETTDAASLNTPNARNQTFSYQVVCTGNTQTLLNTCSFINYYPNTCAKNCTCDCTGKMSCHPLGHGQDCDASGVLYICRQGEGGPNCACTLAPVAQAPGTLVSPQGWKCTGTPSAATGWEGLRYDKVVVWMGLEVAFWMNFFIS